MSTMELKAKLCPKCKMCEEKFDIIPIVELPCEEECYYGLKWLRTALIQLSVGCKCRSVGAEWQTNFGDMDVIDDLELLRSKLIKEWNESIFMMTHGKLVERGGGINDKQAKAD